MACPFFTFLHGPTVSLSLFWPEQPDFCNGQVDGPGSCGGKKSNGGRGPMRSVDRVMSNTQLPRNWMGRRVLHEPNLQSPAAARVRAILARGQTLSRASQECCSSPPPSPPLNHCYGSAQVLFISSICYSVLSIPCWGCPSLSPALWFIISHFIHHPIYFWISEIHCCWWQSLS